MKKSYNQSTPKIVGGSVIMLITLAALYVFVLNPEQAEITAKSTITTTSKTSQTTAKPSASVAQPPAEVTTDTQTPTPTTTQTPETPTATTESQAPVIADGTYTESVDYFVKGETNQLTVTVSVADGVITAVSTESTYGDRESLRYISSFENSVESAVVGEKIDGLSKSRIGSASLTTQAFHDAINTMI